VGISRSVVLRNGAILQISPAILCKDALQWSTYNGGWGRSSLAMKQNVSCNKNVRICGALLCPSWVRLSGGHYRTLHLLEVPGLKETLRLPWER
jgi:hypothetical protein